MMVMMMTHILFAEDVNNEGSEGNEGTGDGDPDGGGGTDGGVAGLHGVRLDIEDIVLLQIVIGRVDNVGIVEIDGMNLLTTLGVLTDELHAVANIPGWLTSPMTEIL